MVNSSTITKYSRNKKTGLDNTQKENKTIVEPPVASNKSIIPEEKVEVLIKEIIRINPRDFSAFKHALEEFVESWEK